MINGTPRLKNVSYTEAAFSCLPVAGPALCLWNMMKIDYERSRAVAALSRLEKKAEEGKCEKEQIQKAREKYINILGKGVTYSKCGMVSSFLTLAALVSLVATAILSTGGGAIPLIMGFVIQAGIYRQNISRYNEDLEEISDGGSLIEREEAPRSIAGAPQGSIEPARAVLAQFVPQLNGDMLSSSTNILGQTTRW